MSLNNPVQLPANEGPVSWNPAEEKAMIDCLVEHKAEAGDGSHFKDTTWTKVAECLQSLRTDGGVKTPKKCKEKWGRVSAVV
jgi:Myb/SANT-like DNA-binding domain